ncbi:hypothetical protein [Pseudobutyrivibrio sp. MD2005]|uniref:hypothetical protein n=1 Tax=Pseudobutyrivibrio sp. MD2005 TaxID=1410616 RepID=UPI00047F10B9|nr:hypothetical protein [Pseudobutyrivibrio sp. MD2005]
MQSKTSFFNFTVFKKNISRTWIVGLLYFIILTLMQPVAFIIQMAHFEEYWYSDSGYTRTACLYESYAYRPNAYIACIVAIVVAGLTFKYLFFKRDNYMVHAFPVSRKSLFFSGFLSSSVVATVPLILNGIVMTIVAAAEHAYAFDAIWYWTLIGVVSVELFLAIAIFSLMTSGQIATAVVFYIIFNYLYFLIELAFRLMASLLLFGMSESLTSISFTPFSPVVFIDNNCMVSTYKTYDELGMIKTFTHSLDGGKYIACYAAVAVVLLIVAYLLYKFKKLETVQDFISVPFLKPVFAVGVSFFVSMVAGAFVAGLVDSIHYQTYNSRFTIAIVATLIIGCIIFLATQMMIEKTVRVFSAKRFGMMVGYTVAALVAMVLIRADVFKVENKIPSANDIAWVGIQSNYTMVFTDEDDILSVRELHKGFLADKQEIRDVNVLYKDVPGGNFTIKYKLKNGKVILRSYAVVDTKSDMVSEAYVSATQPILDYLNNPAQIKEHIIGNIWNNCDIKEMSFSTYTYDENLNDFVSNWESFDYLTEREKKAKFKKVYDAVLKDIDEGNLFTTSFGEDNYNPEIDDQLYNDFSFTVSNKKIPYFSDEDTYWDYQYMDPEPTYERNIYAALTRKCTNTLKALKDEGFYYDDSEILTYEEYNKAMGNPVGEGPILY